MSDRSQVLLEQVGCAAIITLNMPAKRNVLTPASVAALVEAMDKAEAEPSVRAVVITGAGRAFCAGADLAILESASNGDFSTVRSLYDGFLRVMRSPLLTISAVNGPAVGAGMNLALVCDIRLAAASATFDTRFARLHIHPGGGNLWLMSQAVGHQNACLAILPGEVWDAPTALSRGLVAEVAPDDELRDRAWINLAQRLAHYDREFISRLLRSRRDALTTRALRQRQASATPLVIWPSRPRLSRLAVTASDASRLR